VAGFVLARNELGTTGNNPLTHPRSSYAGRPARAIAAIANPTTVAAGTAPGTCLAFDPLNGDRHETVYIDPGHGGIDTGTSGTTSAGATVYEKDLTLATGLDLLGSLRDNGYRVVISRIDDRLLIRPIGADASMGALTLARDHDDTEARIACANAAHANVLVSLHFNGFSDPSAGGTETIYDKARTFSAANARLAALAQRDVLAQFHAAGWPVPDRGVIDDISVGTPALTTEAAAYGHLLELGPKQAGWLDHPSAMPGIVIEPLFLSRPTEADVASSTNGQQAIARGILQALNTFFAPSKHT
jgi:N-acetylmuramoyl-L-alanine amidase